MAGINPNHYGLAVGINWYPMGLQELDGAVADASAFRDWMTSEHGGRLDPDNVVLLTSPEEGERDANDPKPLLSSIALELTKLNRKQLERLDEAGSSREEMRSASRLYFYVAGHGIGKGRAPALLDAAAYEAALTNLDLGGFLDWYLESGIFREICFIGDCCRISKPHAPGPWLPWPAPVSEGGTVEHAMFMGGKVGQATQEDNGRGVFTRALLDGLTGSARVENDVITRISLQNYVDKVMGAHFKDVPPWNRQEAVLDGSDAIVFPAPDPQPALRRLVLQRPDGVRGELQIRDGSTLAIVETWPVGQDTLPVELPDRDFLLVPSAPQVTEQESDQFWLIEVGGRDDDNYTF